MVDMKPQAPVTQATADFMRAISASWALAANASAFQAMNFWTRMLRSSLIAPVAPMAVACATPLARTCDASADAPADETVHAQPETTEAPAKPAPVGESHAEPGFASYRSSSGHAVAQVIVSDAT